MRREHGAEEKAEKTEKKTLTMLSVASPACRHQRRKRAPPSLLLLAVTLLCCHLLPADAHSVRHLSREFPGLNDNDAGPDSLSTSSKECDNTETGPWLIADSSGYVCSRDRVDTETGCCPHASAEKRPASPTATTSTTTSPRPFSCAGCDAEAQCCVEYEHCVSCCLKPGHGADELYKTEFRSKGRPETGRWDSPFHYCASKCRTTSVVTVHENAYISPAHHCWSSSGIPHVPKKEGTPPLPSGARVVAGGPGETCEAACGVLGQVCSPGGSLPLNDCNVLRDHFHCEAGCVDASTTRSPSSSASLVPAPSYVVSTAPEELRPATCLTVPKEAQASAGCDLPSPAGAGGEHFRRLCVCLEPGGMR